MDIFQRIISLDAILIPHIDPVEGVADHDEPLLISFVQMVEFLTLHDIVTKIEGMVGVLDVEVVDECAGDADDSAHNEDECVHYSVLRDEGKSELAKVYLCPCTRQ